MRRLSWLLAVAVLSVSCTEGGGDRSQPGGGGSGGFLPEAGSGGSTGGSGGNGGTGGSGGNDDGGSGGGGGGPGPSRLASGEIGPEGGVLTTPDGTVSIQVPYGALRSTLTFTVDTVVRPTPGAIGRVIELGPHGVQFDQPVTVFVAPTPGVAPARQRLATAVDGATWEELPGHVYDPFANRIRAQAAHFSEFGLVHVDLCVDDGDCAEGEVCHRGSGDCAPPVSCDPADPYFCGGGNDCSEEELICRFVCSEAEYCQGFWDDDCDGEIDEGCPTCADVPGGEVCDGTCVDTNQDAFHCGGCGKPCGASAVCLDARCWPLGGDSCRTDDDCDEGLFCFEGTCEPEPIACRRDVDCPSFLRCIEGFCY